MELARCAGLSDSQVNNILSNSHAQNNGAVPFTIACAMMIYLTNMIVTKKMPVAKAVKEMQNSGTAKNLSISTQSLTCQGFVAAYSANHSRSRPSRLQGVVYDVRTELITEEVQKVGDNLKERIESMYCGGPYGTYSFLQRNFIAYLPQ